SSRCTLVQELRQYPAIPTGINNKFSLDLTLATIFMPYSCYGISTVECDVFHHSFKSNIHTSADQNIRQCFIKIGSGQLPGPIPAISRFLTEIEPAHIISTQKASTIFSFESLFFHFLNKTSFIKRVHTSGNKTLSDDKSWETFFFDNLYRNA